MSSGHFSKTYKVFKRIKTGTTVHFKERISNFTSITSKDPTLISKIEEAKIQKPSAADRIVKVIQIQTGSGQRQDNETSEELNTEEGLDKCETDSNSSSSSISLNFEIEDSDIESTEKDKFEESSTNKRKNLTKKNHKTIKSTKVTISTSLNKQNGRTTTN